MIDTHSLQPSLSAGERVTLLCDWSNLRHTGEQPIETRSGESMAQAQTREELLLMTFCSALQGALGGQGG